MPTGDAKGFQHWADQGLETRDQVAPRRQHESSLAGDDDSIPSMAEDAADEALALPLTVDIGGIEKGDAVVVGRRQDVGELDGIAFEDATDPRAAQAVLGDEQV